MEQKKLRQMIKVMYLLKKILISKKDDDRAFKLQPKEKMIDEVNLIIDRSLEEFYSLRTG